jgi:hypothetical protein
VNSNNTKTDFRRVQKDRPELLALAQLREKLCPQHSRRGEQHRGSDQGALQPARNQRMQEDEQQKANWEARWHGR